MRSAHSASSDTLARAQLADDPCTGSDQKMQHGPMTATARTLRVAIHHERDKVQCNMVEGRGVYETQTHTSTDDVGLARTVGND